MDGYNRRLFDNLRWCAVRPCVSLGQALLGIHNISTTKG